MPFCAPRTSCSRLLADDSPVRPCRQPRYTLSRLPSLDGEPSDGQTEKHVSADRSVSGNSSTRTVIRKQPDTGPEVVTASQSQLCVDAERRISSMQKLRRRVQLTKGTKSVSETQPKVEFGQTKYGIETWAGISSLPLLTSTAAPRPPASVVKATFWTCGASTSVPAAAIVVTIQRSTRYLRGWRTMMSG